MQLLALFAFILFCSASTACLWDSDTLADEAKGHGDIIEIITGRFPRNPPLYYEMRLERVSKELISDPDELEDYDDAGVACDRLGRGDEAIEWMAKKRAALERSGLPADHDQWYRYHANLGTFLAHKWFRNGKDFSDMADLKQGAEHIRKALEINPDAHFGREEYQLKFMEWVLAKPEAVKARDLSYESGSLADFLGFDYEADIPDDELNKASRGVVGLVALGNAWESVDAFFALQRIHYKLNNGSIALLARKRALELVSIGKKPVLGEDLTSETLGELISYDTATFTADPEHEFGYSALRANADEWHAHRSKFMAQKLRLGVHPDTHPDFWTGYTEIPKLDLPVNGEALSQAKNRQLINEMNDKFRLWERIAMGVAATLGGWLIYRRLRRQKTAGIS